MGLFGGKDKSQDAQLKVMQQDIANCWQWIQQHEKNMQILIKNNNAFIAKNKKNKKTLATLQNHISTLEATIAGMKARDEKFDAAIKALSAISTTTTEREE